MDKPKPKTIIGRWCLAPTDWADICNDVISIFNNQEIFEPVPFLTFESTETLTSALINRIYVCTSTAEVMMELTLQGVDYSRKEVVKFGTILKRNMVNVRIYGDLVALGKEYINSPFILLPRMFSVAWPESFKPATTSTKQTFCPTYALSDESIDAVYSIVDEIIPDITYTEDFSFSLPLAVYPSSQLGVCIDKVICQNNKVFLTTFPSAEFSAFYFAKYPLVLSDFIAVIKPLKAVTQLLTIGSFPEQLFTVNVQQDLLKEFLGLKLYFNLK